MNQKDVTPGCTLSHTELGLVDVTDRHGGVVRGTIRETNLPIPLSLIQICANPDWTLVAEGMAPTPREEIRPDWIQACIVLGYRPSVCRSNAGYYIGALDTDGCPYARYSEEYWATPLAAGMALDTGKWIRRLHP